MGSDNKSLAPAAATRDQAVDRTAGLTSTVYSPASALSAQLTHRFPSLINSVCKSSNWAGFQSGCQCMFQLNFLNVIQSSRLLCSTSGLEHAG